MTNFEEYIETALWLETDGDEDHSLSDRGYTIHDIDTESIKFLRLEFDKFMDDAMEMIQHNQERAAQDFWLTRNRTGAGFWDGDWPEHGDALTKLAHSFGECNLHVGDDNKLYHT